MKIRQPDAEILMLITQLFVCLAIVTDNKIVSGVGIVFALLTFYRVLK